MREGQQGSAIPKFLLPTKPAETTPTTPCATTLVHGPYLCAGAWYKSPEVLKEEATQVGRWISAADGDGGMRIK